MRLSAGAPQPSGSYEAGTLQIMYWMEIRTVPPVKLPLVAVTMIDVAE
jgi:hypothetical protein